MTFSDIELEYLADRHLGRLATIGPNGPQVNPVTFRLNADSGTIDISGPALTSSQKYRNVRSDPRVSFVVDDESDKPNVYGQRGRGIEIRGQVEIVSLDQPFLDSFENETLRVHPRRIIAWNIEGASYDARDVP
jgi:pyridoxamine 5'-phosphate oxidase family protein